MAVFSAVGKHFNAQKSLFTPWVDFLMIGGLGLLLLPLCYYFPRGDQITKEIIAFSWGLQFLINFPHFAFSYQLLYENILGKLKDKTYPSIYRLKILNAAFIVPVALIGWTIFGYYQGSTKLLGYMVNAMFFFVGWHYVKQGFGMLIVISAINKFYFSARERHFIIGNTYVAWLTAWVFSNLWLKDIDLSSKGIPYQAVDVPQEAILVLLIANFFNLSAIGQYFYRLYKNSQPFPPLNALTGYVSSVYLWVVLVFVFHPIYVAFIPALHSLQYILFVMKYKTAESTESSSQPMQGSSINTPLNRFIFWGIILGAAGFFFVPYSLDYLVTVDYSIYGPTFFLFAFSIFINIHHYFIDNVIWRRENKKVHQYLMH